MRPQVRPLSTLRSSLQTRALSPAKKTLLTPAFRPDSYLPPWSTFEM